MNIGLLADNRLTQPAQLPPCIPLYRFILYNIYNIILKTTTHLPQLRELCQQVVSVWGSNFPSIPSTPSTPTLLARTFQRTPRNLNEEEEQKDEKNKKKRKELNISELRCIFRRNVGCYFSITLNSPSPCCNFAL